MKIRYFSTLFFALCASAHAASFYIAPGLAYQDAWTDTQKFNGLSPSLFLGYGAWVRDYLHMAGELMVSTTAIDLKKNDDQGVPKVGSSYGVSIVPTIMLDRDLLAYARLGYVRTDFSGVTHKTGAYQMGIGGEYDLSSAWSVRLEYAFTPYRSISTIGTVKVNTFTLSAVYRLESLFDGPVL